MSTFETYIGYEPVFVVDTAESSRHGMPLPDGLTRREGEVLGLLASGLTNRQMADRLVLSVHTIERHLNNAYCKIRARNRAAAAAYSVRHGLCA
jgi:DNA-binding NarL/FixJ family response regulator